jgi:hypothetical protein
MHPSIQKGSNAPICMRVCSCIHAPDVYMHPSFLREQPSCFINVYYYYYYYYNYICVYVSDYVHLCMCAHLFMSLSACIECASCLQESIQSCICMCLYSPYAHIHTHNNELLMKPLTCVQKGRESIRYIVTKYDLEKAVSICAYVHVCVCICVCESMCLCASYFSSRGCLSQCHSRGCLSQCHSVSFGKPCGQVCVPVHNTYTHMGRFVCLYTTHIHTWAGLCACTQHTYTHVCRHREHPKHSMRTRFDEYAHTRVHTHRYTHTHTHGCRGLPTTIMRKCWSSRHLKHSRMHMRRPRQNM